MKQVLFVDDEKLILDGLRRSLRSKRGEWNMHFASGVAEALAILEEHDMDVVTTDVNMPERNGFDLLSTIRGTDLVADIPVIILTGNGEQGMKRTALDMGATDLLGKPVDREELIARISSAIRLKEAQDTIKSQNAVLESRVRERTAQLEVARVELIWRLGKAGEFRDSNTGYHIVRVGFFTGEIARTMGLEESFAKRAELASPLHDIGKIGIPDGILLKPGRLDPDEWEIMRRHTTIGAQILRDEVVASQHLQQLGMEPGSVITNPHAEMAADIAESHHERWDGQGYPHGLVGDQIPMAARLTSLADVYDALSSARPYKPAIEESKTLDLMASGRGSQFDPQVFEAFEAALPRLREIQSRFADSEQETPQADMHSALAALASASRGNS